MSALPVGNLAIQKFLLGETLTEEQKQLLLAPTGATSYVVEVPYSISFQFPQNFLPLHAMPGSGYVGEMILIKFPGKTAIQIADDDNLPAGDFNVVFVGDVVVIYYPADATIGQFLDYWQAERTEPMIYSGVDFNSSIPFPSVSDLSSSGMLLNGWTMNAPAGKMMVAGEPIWTNNNEWESSQLGATTRAGDQFNGPFNASYTALTTRGLNVDAYSVFGVSRMPLAIRIQDNGDSASITTSNLAGSAIVQQFPELWLTTHISLGGPAFELNTLTDTFLNVLTGSVSLGIADEFQIVIYVNPLHFQLDFTISQTVHFSATHKISV